MFLLQVAVRDSSIQLDTLIITEKIRGSLAHRCKRSRQIRRRRRRIVVELRVAGCLWVRSKSRRGKLPISSHSFASRGGINGFHFGLEVVGRKLVERPRLPKTMMGTLNPSQSRKQLQQQRYQFENNRNDNGIPVVVALASILR